ncbi:hypothetical protein ZWY2020_035387 [Hordeum vulgare]|nr:hypothetical protein ZWY2020_035387 [Hordeum vulgare]
MNVAPPSFVTPRRPRLSRSGHATSATSSFELFYDDGAGSGLRPLPESMSDFLMGSGFERLLEQLAQIEAGGATRPGRCPAATCTTRTASCRGSRCATRELLEHKEPRGGRGGAGRDG